MQLKMLNAAVVVLSEGNNPRLLNQDFLERNHVVPAEWKVHDVLVTAPFARVIYENGVHFHVEINKLQIQVDKPDLVDWEKMLPEMAVNYLNLLPHVTYRAVGINFVFDALHCAERPFLSLLSKGQWLTAYGELSGAGVDLHYHGRLPHLNVKIEFQKSADTVGAMQEGLRFTVNFHHDFEPADAAGRAAFIRSAASLKERFLEFAETLPFD